MFFLAFKTITDNFLVCSLSYSFPERILLRQSGYKSKSPKMISKVFWSLQERLKILNINPAIRM